MIKQNKLHDFDVVFIDSSPWMSRKCCFEYYLNLSEIIIIHDFDYFPINNIIGKVINEEITHNNGKSQRKIKCDLDGIVKNYKLFYPPDEYFAGLTGPPTLVCSNVMEDDKFNALIKTIELNNNAYYA